MKVLANGGLNLSQLDGWWAEACTDEVGWGIGDGAEHGPQYDEQDADQLYALLEQQVVPAFYERDGQGVPRQWIRRMRASMATLVTQFSADRAVREYTEHYYLPAAMAYQQRIQEHSRLARQLTQVREELHNHWPAIRFQTLEMSPGNGRHRVSLSMDLAGLSPVYLRVQLYAEARDGSPAQAWDLRLDPTAHADGLSVYRGEVPDDRPAEDYTGRVIADASAGLAVPLEVGLITWQR
jgi:starch phosphorylase